MCQIGGCAICPKVKWQSEAIQVDYPSASLVVGIERNYLLLLMR
jgi:hypothetical protein